MRVEEILAAHEFLRVDPLVINFVRYWPRLQRAAGLNSKVYDDGGEVDLAQFWRIRTSGTLPLYKRAAEEAVGTRREAKRATYMLNGTMFLPISGQSADLLYASLQEHLGEDCRMAMDAYTTSIAFTFSCVIFHRCRVRSEVHGNLGFC